MPKEVDSFIERLKTNLVAAKAEQYQLQKVDKRDQGILNSSISQKILVNTYERILQDAAMLEKIKQLKPGEAIYVKRPKGSADIRTFNILMDADGQLCLFIEPKSKRFDNTKRLIKWLGGSFKTRKIALRADTPTGEAFVSLVEYVKDKQSEVERVKGEQDAAIQFRGIPGFARCISGGEAIKVKRENGDFVVKQRIITYAPYRPANLQELIEGKWSAPGVDFSADEYQALFCDVMRQMLKIIQEMHAKGVEHKDLKPENFLVEYDYDKARFVVEVIDFGLHQKFGEVSAFRGTPRFIPPWVFAGKKIASLKSNHLWKPKEYLAVHLLSLIYGKNPVEIPDVDAESKKVDGKHDVWSFGVICCRILFGQDKAAKETLEDLPTYNFLDKLFNRKDDPTAEDIKPSAIPDINEVIKLFESEPDIQEMMKHLPKPEEHAYDSALDEDDIEDDDDDNDATDIQFNLMLKELLTEKGYLGLIDQVAGQDPSVDKSETIRSFTIVCPAAIFAVNNDRTNFEQQIDAEKLPRFYKDSYDLIMNFHAGDLHTKSVAELESFVVANKELLEKVNLYYEDRSKSTRLDDATWMDYARWQLFLNTAICMAQMLIDQSKVQEKVMVQKPKSKWKLPLRFKSKEKPSKVQEKVEVQKPKSKWTLTLLFKGNEKPKLKDVSSYKQEIEGRKALIKALIDDTNRELMAKTTFTKTFGKQHL